QLPVGSPIRQSRRSIGGIPQTVVEVPFDGNDGEFLPQLNWDNMLDRVIVGPSTHPDVVKQALEAELRFQNTRLWDQLVNISEIPLRAPS
ncbi:MAG: hypothetical protein Q7J32_12520, partial [Sphingomonadaceae bacterium]|nr:hypothetical protein [Sphingomonadaceae bacterium]